MGVPKVGREPSPTISMRPVLYEDGSFGVELTMTGLTSQQQAQAAILHMQRLFCGQEIDGQ